MARKRDIKPGYWTNELLAECSPFARLLGVAVLNLADRKGRMEDRPKRIKAQCLPYDDVDVSALLDELVTAKYIERYDADGINVIEICKFVEHQSIHPNEAESQLPANPKHEKTRQSREKQTMPKEVKEGIEYKEGKEGKGDLAAAEPAEPVEPLKPPKRTPTPKPEPLAKCPALPEKLNTEPVRLALTKWATYKAARGESYKSSHGWSELLTRFEPLGPEVLIAAINASISNNYAGVFPDKLHSGLGKHPPESRFQRPEIDRSKAAERKIFKAERKAPPAIAGLVAQVVRAK
jgi:hypothetical protein